MANLGVAEKTLLGLLIVVILVTAFIMNFLVCFVVYRNRLLRQQFSSVFIVNLAVCDLLMALLAMPFSLGAVVSSSWPFRHIVCQLTGFTNQVLGISTILTLAVISIDRFYAVIKPLKYRAKMTMQKATWSIVYVWAQALTFSVVPALGKWYVFNEHYFFCTFASYFRTQTETAFASSLYFANFALPLLVMLATYYKIFKVARRHSQRIAPAVFNLGTFGTVRLVNLREEMGRQREAKAARKILLVIAAFLCCNVPYTFMRMLELATGHILQLPRSVTIGAKWINFLNSTLNPAIYGLLQRRFRAALTSVFRLKIRDKRPSSSFFYFSTQSRNTDRPAASLSDTAPQDSLQITTHGDPRVDRKFWLF